MRDLPLVGEEFAGYRLLSVLGHGGMSTVYQAQNPRLGNVIALKVLSPQLAGNDLFRARFLEESRIAASLNHPNVVPVHDSGPSDGLLYIAMRYVTGTDLRQVLNHHGRLAPERAVFLLSQAARALDAAHRVGLVHRDVKPGNLLIEAGVDEADPDHVYLTDFGITKHVTDNSGLSATGRLTGTLDYISPEQVLGQPVLGRADQYSLGCVLYECLTGQGPFARDTDTAMIRSRIEEAPPRPTAACPGLPAAIDAVLARVLAVDPGDRYASCREFMAAAAAALTSPAPSPVPAGRPDEIAHESRGNVPATSADAPAPEDLPAPDPPPAAQGSPSGGRPRRRSRKRMVPYAAAALVLAAGLGAALAELASGGTTQVSLSGRGTEYHGTGQPGGTASGGTQAMGSSPQSSASASPSSSPSMNMGVQASDGESGPGTLAGVLAAANSSVEGRNLLPAGKCGNYQQNAGGAIVCTNPVPGVAQVFYQNYSSLTALYDAYKAQITQLDGGKFAENTHTCGNSAVGYAEFGWNMEEGHPHNFTVAQMTAGKVEQIYAAGRMACFETKTPQGGVSQDIVWTIDNGPAMGVAIGDGSPSAVYNLWASLHHAVEFRDTEMCGTSGRMNFSDIPTGNLKVLPVCPSGVEAVPAGS